MADDDLDYQLIVKCVLEELGFRGVFLGVKNGQELTDYLFRRGKHRNARTPDLIILDLNMPEKDGRSALQEIKKDSSLRQIPVAVLTTSAAEEDIELCNRLRRCSYKEKPATYEEWSRVIEEILSENLQCWGPADLMLGEAVETVNSRE